MAQLLNDCRVLMGYMGEHEAMSFMTRRCVFTGDRDEKAREVYSKFARTAAKPPRLPTKVRVKEFDAATVKDLEEKVSTEKVRPGALRGLPWSFKKVEIDGLICVQKYVNASYVGMISRGCDFKNDRDVVDLCLTERFLNRSMTVIKSDSHEYHVSADGDDLRIIGLNTSYDEKTTNRVVSANVGWGVSAVLVVKVGERYYLKNGSHRLYALRANGIEFVPCILIEGKSYSNLGNPGQPGFFSEALTTSDRAPTFAAFFDVKLSTTLKIRPRHTLITVIAKILKTPSEEDASLKDLITSQERGEEANIEDVKVESEGWTAYQLSDGNALKIRQLLKGIKRSTDEKGTATYVGAQTPVLLSVLPKRLGTPSIRNYTESELRSSVVEEKVGFKKVKDADNEYSTGSGLAFRHSLELVQVSRTSKFDQDGIPIYLVRTESKIEQL